MFGYVHKCNRYTHAFESQNKVAVMKPILGLEDDFEFHVRFWGVWLVMYF